VAYNFVTLIDIIIL